MRSNASLRVALLLSLTTSFAAGSAFAQKLKGVSRQPQALTKPGWKEQQAVYNHVMLDAQNHGLSSNAFITNWQAGEHSNSRKSQTVYVTLAEQPIYYPMGAATAETGTAPSRSDQMKLMRPSAAAPANTSIMPPWRPPLYERTWSATFTVRRAAASKQVGLVPGKLQSVTNTSGWQESLYRPGPPILPLNAAASTPATP